MTALSKPEIPENLLEYSWAGSLPKKVVAANKPVILISFGVVLLIGLLIAGLVWLITRNPTHLYLAIPISTWLWSIMLYVIYASSTRDVRILELGEDGRYYLNTARWFKRAPTGFKEADALYENGRRVLWVHQMPDGMAKPLHVWDAKPRKSGGNPATAAQIAGIKSYTESVRTYAFKKTLTLQDQIKYGLMVGGIALLLLGMFLMSGRLLRDPVDTAPQPTPAINGQAAQHQAQRN